MPGQVPIRNGKFSNAPDFNNQGVTGITGLGVFRQFSSIFTNTANLVLNSGHLWRSINTSGNLLVTAPTPASLSANVGDEILFSSSNGTITLAPTNVVTTAYSSYTSRTIRLVCINSNQWIITGLRGNYLPTNVADCCGTSILPFYTFNGAVSGVPAWVTDYGQTVYNSSSYTLGGIIYSADNDQAYYILNGNISISDCVSSIVTWNVQYIVYNSTGVSLLIYSPYGSIGGSIIDPALVNTPFKTYQDYSGYLCDTSFAVAAGTYYAYYDPIYGVSNPICFDSSGLLVNIGGAC